VIGSGRSNNIKKSSSSLGTGLPNRLPTRRTGHNPPRGPSADWWVLTTANAAGTNGLTCLPKHGGARDDKVENKVEMVRNHRHIQY
jgi:hypothetical protein